MAVHRNGMTACSDGFITVVAKIDSTAQISNARLCLRNQHLE